MKTAVTGSIELFRGLERSAERVRGAGGATIGRIEVLDDEPFLGVRIEILGEGRSARRAAERIFDDLWYDAFGHRGVGREISVVEGEGKGWEGLRQGTEPG